MGIMKRAFMGVGFAFSVAALAWALVGCASEHHRRAADNVAPTGENAPTSYPGYLADQSRASTPMRKLAKMTIRVQKSDAKPYDQTVQPELLEVHLTERFAGDIEGESAVRALQIKRDESRASMISLQRVSGKLNGRQGTFVLTGQENVEDGKIKATWFVVSGSGTGELSGLRGQGGFEGDFGKGSEGTLEYWFE